MIHAISGWLTRHARRNRGQLARDHAHAARNGWQARKISNFGTWEYRDPRFTTLRPIRTLPAAVEADAGRRCPR